MTQVSEVDGTKFFTGHCARFDRLLEGLVEDTEMSDPGTLYLLAGMASALLPGSIVVEAGTFRGHAAAAIAAAAPHVDVYTADTERFDIPFYQESNVCFHHGDYTEMLEKLRLTNIGLAFLDSGPTHDEASASVPKTIRLDHYHATRPRMTPGGLIVVHDVLFGPWEGMTEILDDATYVIKTPHNAIAIIRI